MQQLHCCIVEDHSDIVPFLHALVRAKKLEFGAAIFHFDAHPDMSLPCGHPVEAWQSSTSLYYDVLNTEGCISEFLLPLSYTKIINEIVWIRSSWCDQFEDGSVSFLVGNSNTNDEDDDGDVKDKTSVAAVTFHAPYYLDEGVVVDKTEIISARTVNFHTCSASDDISQLEFINNHSRNTSKINWILDICLDYFTTGNPFLPALVASLEQDAASSTSPSSTSSASSIYQISKRAGEMLLIIQEMYRKLMFRQPRSSHGGNSEIKNVAKFCRTLREHSFVVINELLKTTTDCVDGAATDGDFVDAASESLKATSTAAQFLLLFPSLHASTREGRDDSDAHRSGSDSVSAPNAFLALLPRLSAHSRQLLRDMGMLVLLPHHRATESEIDASLVELEQFIIRSSLRCPSAVTIARSSLDEFCPPDQVLYSFYVYLY